jgi:hypothetical protein
MFPSVDELREKFEEMKYVVDEVTIRQVCVAGVLQKPILIEGPPGCGKTKPAKAVAFALGSNVERLQCYPGIDAERRRSAGSIQPCRNSSSRPNRASSEPTGNPSARACTHWTSSYKGR